MKTWIYTCQKHSGKKHFINDTMGILVLTLVRFLLFCGLQLDLTDLRVTLKKTKRSRYSAAKKVTTKSTVSHCQVYN